MKNNINENDKEIMFTCLCKDEALVAELYDEDFWPEKELALAFYKAGIYIPKPSLKDRIKWALEILKTGTIYNDYILLNMNDAKKFGKWLLKISEDTKELKTENSKKT